MGGGFNRNFSGSAMNNNRGGGFQPMGGFQGNPMANQFGGFNPNGMMNGMRGGAGGMRGGRGAMGNAMGNTMMGMPMGGMPMAGMAGAMASMNGPMGMGNMGGGMPGMIKFNIFLQLMSPAAKDSCSPGPVVGDYVTGSLSTTYSLPTSSCSH